MNTVMLLEKQLLATKFFVPVASGPLIARPRLSALLNESLKYPLTLVSAPAGFGKTTLLTAWAQSLPTGSPLVAWVSLDEEDNDPRMFWTYVLTALNRQQPERFTALLEQLQSPQGLPLKYILAALINLLVERSERFVLILDDYQVISEPQVHRTLTYLIEHLPPQLRLILSTRADPPFTFSQLRVRQQLLEIRTEWLRCTTQEIRTFFQQIMGLELADETIEQVATRTEGWLVGLQLLGLSLQGNVEPTSLLEEVSGDQRYILDYLTEVVLQQQSQEVQRFLLATSILERLSASLCDALLEQTGSQQMLQQLERANLFVVSLDSTREWYRYHALFTQALHSQLELLHPNLMSGLHYRASLWYAKHDQTIQAIVHAFHAKEWSWAADLIESKYFPLMELTQRVDEHALLTLRGWVEQLPAEVIYARPRLCLSCAMLLWMISPQSMIRVWLRETEATMRTWLQEQMQENIADTTLIQHKRQEQENVLGEVLTWQAFLQSYEEDGQGALSLCQQALPLLSPRNNLARLQVGCAQLWAAYCSCENDADTAIHYLQQAISLGLQSAPIASSVACMGNLVMHMLGAGHLWEGYQLSQQAIELGRLSAGPTVSSISSPIIFQAEILREWNHVERASSLLEDGICLCRQKPSLSSLSDTLFGSEMLLRIALSRGDYDAAYSALQQIERIGARMNQSWYRYHFALFTIIDQVRLWLACGKLDQAVHWAKHVEIKEHSSSPFASEREEVAQARILLATAQPTQALQRLQPVLQRATAGWRWGHVIETRLLQALAYQMCQQTTPALDALSQALQLAEPQGYIRSFVEEGSPMEILLTLLRKRDCRQGPTPYVDTLLAAFQQETREHAQEKESTKAQPLPKILSERELQVLHQLACGASNLEIAQTLVITIDTVKRHVSHIFAKLDVQNRVQAIRRSQELGLLGEEP